MSYALIFLSKSPSIPLKPKRWRFETESCKLGNLHIRFITKSCPRNNAFYYPTLATHLEGGKLKLTNDFDTLVEDVLKLKEQILFCYIFMKNGDKMEKYFLQKMVTRIPEKRIIEEGKVYKLDYIVS